MPKAQPIAHSHAASIGPSAAQLGETLARARNFVAVAFDAAGNISFLNAGAALALGYDAGELNGKPASVILRNADAALLSPGDKEWDFLCKDGSAFAVPVIVEALPEAGVLAFGRNSAAWKRHAAAIADREQLIEKLTESNAEFERFAYVASHDMQEPLRAMSSFSDIIAADYRDALDDDGKLYLRLIREAAARMQTMVVDLLEYARVGKDAARADPFDAG
jgi:signal transduction histidine kinase